MLKVPTFKMETVTRISKCIIEKLWGVIIDLQDAFFLIPIAWYYHKYFAFTIDGRTLVFQFMPFGLSLAPWAFTRIMRPIMREIHRKGIMSFCLLDDFLLTATSPAKLTQKSKELLDLFQDLRIEVNWRKSVLMPRQKLEYLGVTFNFANMTLSLPKEKISNILKEVHSTLQKVFCTRRELESLIGLLNFAALYLPLGRLHLLPIIQWNNAHTRAKHRDLPVTLSPLFKKPILPNPISIYIKIIFKPC